MKPSALYLACYDIRDHRRLRQALNVLRDYALGRQKSVFECPLDPGDTGALVDSVKTVIDESEDRFALVRLDRRGAMHAIGRGVVVDDDDDIFYVG